jgi:hypothetical protein
MVFNLRDTLACVYYLRVCEHLCYADKTDRFTEAMRDDFHRNLARCVNDSRSVPTHDGSI